jgi:hypothetical protein
MFIILLCSVQYFAVCRLTVQCTVVVQLNILPSSCSIFCCPPVQYLLSSCSKFNHSMFSFQLSSILINTVCILPSSMFIILLCSVQYFAICRFTVQCTVVVQLNILPSSCSIFCCPPVQYLLSSCSKFNHYLFSYQLSSILINTVCILPSSMFIILQ